MLLHCGLPLNTESKSPRTNSMFLPAYQWNLEFGGEMPTQGSILFKGNVTGYNISQLEPQEVNSHRDSIYTF